MMDSSSFKNKRVALLMGTGSFTHFVFELIVKKRLKVVRNAIFNELFL